jgi:hypothetical protein
MYLHLEKDLLTDFLDQYQGAGPRNLQQQRSVVGRDFGFLMVRTQAEGSAAEPELSAFSPKYSSIVARVEGQSSILGMKLEA